MSKEAMKMINVTRSSMPSFEEYCEEIRPLWESRWLTNMGAKHKELESNLQEYLQTPHVALYTPSFPYLYQKHFLNIKLL